MPEWIVIWWVYVTILFNHYVIHDLWDNMWSNILAPSVFTVGAVMIAHAKQMRARERQHRELKEHITRTLAN